SVARVSLFLSRYRTIATIIRTAIDLTKNANEARTAPMIAYFQTSSFFERTHRSIAIIAAICTRVNTHSDITVDVARKANAGDSMIPAPMPIAGSSGSSRTRTK